MAPWEGSHTGLIERGQSGPKMEDREIIGWGIGGAENGAMFDTVQCTERT